LFASARNMSTFMPGASWERTDPWRPRRRLDCVSRTHRKTRRDLHRYLPIPGVPDGPAQLQCAGLPTPAVSGGCPASCRKIPTGPFCSVVSRTISVPATQHCAKSLKVGRR
jgi:hypothetical protein